MVHNKKGTRTIREAIKTCLDLTPEGVLPLPFPYVLRALAKILYVDAALRVGVEITPDDKVLACLSDDISLNSMAQWLQLSGFLRWWLEQEETFWFDFENDGEDDTSSAWYDFTAIANKWNEYAEGKLNKND